MRPRTEWMLGLVGLLALAAPAAAQGPDKFTNLQVLPATTSRQELTTIMRAFTGALGVRCDYCHVEQGEERDFASDAKDTKKAARVMMQMVRSLNPQIAKDLPAQADPRGRVGCFTCHRGMAKPPKQLDEVLADSATAGGASAAIQKYKDLRASDIENGTYDFRARSVSGAAARLLAAGKGAEAVALAKAGRDLFPNQAAYLVTVGQLCLEAKDTACAGEAIGKALELDPSNEGAKRAQAALKKATGAQ